MKRFSLLGLGFVGLVGSMLAGCPIFGDGDGGSRWSQCQDGSCGCAQPSDCAGGLTCGADGACHQSDCTDPSVGCPNGYTCEVTTNLTAQCIGTSGNGGSGTGGSGSGGSSTGGATTSSSASTSTSSSTTSTSTSSSTSSASSSTSSTSSSTSASSSTSGSTSSSAASGSSSSGAPVIYCGHPADCAVGQICSANGTCQPGPCSATNACILGYTCANDGTCQGPANSCNADSDCSNLGTGYECIAGATTGGMCTAPGNQCFDQSQCDPGDSCVQGKCVPACTSNAQCRDGFACNTITGVCTIPTSQCSITNDCGGPSLVCVGGACVPRSTNGVCGAGDVWDENGCVPNQTPTFTCGADGSQGSCAAGSICLHHDCWISCDTPNQNACAQQTTLNECKPVAAGNQLYHVCGSSQNLGSQCGAGTQNNAACSMGQVCIDGFCR